MIQAYHRIIRCVWYTSSILLINDIWYVAETRWSDFFFNLQSVKILGEKLVELELTRSTVSEVLRIFLEAHGYETEVCNTLRTKPFHALPPDTKAAILGFLVEELNSSNTVIKYVQDDYLF